MNSFRLNKKALSLEETDNYQVSVMVISFALLMLFAVVVSLAQVSLG